MGKKDFFLEPDDAQTMGDINYMRKSVKVRRTFPKTLKNKDGFAIEKQVSASEDLDLSKMARAVQPQSNGFYTAPASKPAPQVQESQAPKAQEAAPAPAPRKSDTGMDMFRNMARNIKKR